jgi:hypothetical protein
MKFVAAILLFCFSLLTIQPGIAKVCRLIQTESCCKKKQKTIECCSKKKSNPCKKEEKKDCCSGGMCTPCTACACCFAAATSERGNFLFEKNLNRADLVAILDQHILSGFISKCFQPPEV